MNAAAENLQAGPQSVSEARRNRLLRRVDWRFLLPDPSPRKTLCLSDGPLVESLRLVSETVVEGWKGERAEGCDLAVAMSPDRKSLAAALTSLRPGGVLYCEWTGLARPSALRRRLEDAGFEGAAFFRPDLDPSEENPAAWIPLSEPGASRHFFLENRGQSRSAWRRAARRVMRSASLVRSRWRPAGPLCAWTRKPASPAGALPGDVTRLVMERWESLSLGPKPMGLSPLLLTGGLRSESKVIVLLFPDSGSRPAVALKISRVRESAPAIRREADILRRLVERAERGSPEGIPRFLFLDEIGGVPVLGETAFSGVPLLSAWTDESYGDLAMKAAAWLADLAETQSPQRPREPWRSRLVDSVLDRFARSFGPVVDARLLDEARRLLGELPDLPLVCEQRDFSPWNLLLTPSNELAVVDWESAELDGLPGLDLIYFLANLCFSLDGARRTGRYRASYRSMLDPTSPRGALAKRCLAFYCDRVGLGLDSLRPLRMLTWLVHSGAEFTRLQADHGTAPDREVLRSAVCLQLFDEEIGRGRRKGGSPCLKQSPETEGAARRSITQRGWRVHPPVPRDGSPGAVERWLVGCGLLLRRPFARRTGDSCCRIRRALPGTTSCSWVDPRSSPGF